MQGLRPAIEGHAKLGYLIWHPAQQGSFQQFSRQLARGVDFEKTRIIRRALKQYIVVVRSSLSCSSHTQRQCRLADTEDLALTSNAVRQSEEHSKLFQLLLWSCDTRWVPNKAQQQLLM